MNEVTLQIIGKDGPIGKTYLQCLLKELLEARGCAVACSEKSTFEYLPPREWNRRIGKFYKGVAEMPFTPMKINLEVISV